MITHILGKKLFLATLSVALLATVVPVLPAQAGIFPWQAKKTQGVHRGGFLSFTTFTAERQAAQAQLPCTWVSFPQNPRSSGYSFLCKGGTWATVSFMLDEAPAAKDGLHRVRLLWREWSPQAHPSGGEGAVTAYFLKYAIARFVPAKYAQEVDKAFWQATPKQWKTQDISVDYAANTKQDHTLHRLEITGTAQAFAFLPARPMQPASVWRKPLPVAPLPVPVEDVVIPAVQQDDRAVAPQPMRLEGVYEDTSKPVQPVKIPVADPVEAATKAPAEAKIPSDKTYQSRGQGVPAYRAMPASSVATDTSSIPTLAKPVPVLDLGVEVDIPAPPSAFVPSAVIDQLKGSPVLQKANDGAVFGAPLPMGGGSLKNQLLEQYYKAEDETDRYRKRAEGDPTPLIEEPIFDGKVVESPVVIQEKEIIPQPVAPIQLKEEERTQGADNNAPWSPSNLNK